MLQSLPTYRSVSSIDSICYRGCLLIAESLGRYRVYLPMALYLTLTKRKLLKWHRISEKFCDLRQVIWTFCNTQWSVVFERAREREGERSLSTIKLDKRFFSS